MVSELSPDSNNSNVNQAQEADPKFRLERKYGADFPTPDQWSDGKAWRKWIESRRKEQEPIMRDKRLHWARHRHFRAGHQWISTRDGRLWREPQADTNDVRAVINIIGPTLDFRLAVLSEQRPGFRYEPVGGGSSGREAAEAQQAVAEYYFNSLRTWNVYLDAWYHAQTDGVSFIHVYVDKNAGPSREDIELVPPTDERYLGLQSQGYTVDPDGNLELPYADEGVPAPPNAQARTLYDGDITHRVLLAHEVVFDPEARTVNGPHDKAKWALVRRMRDIKQARLETGDSKLESETTITSQSDVLDMPIDRSMGWQRGLPPFPTRRQRVQDGVPEYLLWLVPDLNEPGLEQGKWLRIIGNSIVEGGEELPGGIIPLARVTDGSADTDIFPRPVMSDWIGDQIAINALYSSLLKHARLFAGGRLMAMKNTLLEETYSAITGSVVEWQGGKPEAFPTIPAGGEAWQLLSFAIKKLEDKGGWNDLARGQLTGSGGASASDISGRAVLATRELFERGFGPAVRAAAEGATEWSHIVIRYAQWLFDEPRLIPAASGRGDLAKRISSEHLGDRPVTYADPETMMPLPRALRQQTLTDELNQGHISLQQYQAKSVYADVRNLHMGDSDIWERAQWVNTMIEERWEEFVGQPPEVLYAPNCMPILYQDVQMGPAQPQAAGTVGPQVQMPMMWVTPHKPALMEIIMNERLPWGMRELAIERYGIYDQLERALNDPTGATPIPEFVIGVPPDKQMMLPALVAGQPGPGGTPAGQPQPPSPQQQGMPLNSPSPNSSPVPTQAENLPKPQLTQVDRQF